MAQRLPAGHASGCEGDAVAAGVPAGHAAAVSPAQGPEQVVIRLLRREVRLVASLLGQLSTVVTAELATLVAAASDSSGSVSRMAEAIQDEDLIQQRLGDVDAALAVFEQIIDSGTVAAGAVETMGVARLRLEEMQARLDRGMAGRAREVAELGPERRSAEIELF